MANTIILPNEITSIKHKLLKDVVNEVNKTKTNLYSKKLITDPNAEIFVEFNGVDITMKKHGDEVYEKERVYYIGYVDEDKSNNDLLDLFIMGEDLTDGYFVPLTDMYIEDLYAVLASIRESGCLYVISNNELPYNIN